MFSPVVHPVAPPLSVFKAPVIGDPQSRPNFATPINPRKVTLLGLSRNHVYRKSYDDMLSSFDTMPYCDGQTDRQLPFDSKYHAYAYKKAVLFQR